MNNPQTKRERVALLREWKQRLGLNGWRIDASLACCPSSIEEPYMSGWAEWHPSVKLGEIKVLAEKFAECPDEFDFEKTLVHELLHLKFGIFYDNSQGIAQDLLHQTIDELAFALVDAKRRDKS
jgi:hypothetical protein